MSRTSFIPMVAALLFSIVFSVDRVHTQGRGGRGQVVLPEGAGKEIVEAQCTKCHALGLLANSGGFTRQGWEGLIGTMVVLPNDQKAQVTEYLAMNFPEQPRPSPVVVTGAGQRFHQGVDGAHARFSTA